MCAESHDQPLNRHVGDRLSEVVSREFRELPVRVFNEDVSQIHHQQRGIQSPPS